jgi:O-antigen/teichoic acid export membrane protein
VLLKKSVYRSAVIFSILSYFLQMFSVLVYLVMIKVLSPTDLGVFNYGRAIYQLMGSGSLGTRLGLDRVLPTASDRSAKVYLNVSITFYLLMVTIIFVVISFFLTAINQLFILSGAIYVISLIIITYARATKNYSKLYKIFVFSGFLPFLGVLLGLCFGNNLVIVIEMYFLFHLVLLFICWLFFRNILSVNIIIRKWRLIGKLLKIGFPLYLNSFVTLLAFTSDRLVIKNLIGYDFLGIYSIVLLFPTFLFVIPNAISQIFAPNITINARNPEIGRLLFSYCLFISVLLCISVLVAYILVPYVVQIFFSKYQYLISEIRLALGIVLPYGISSVLTYYFLSIDRRWRILFINIFVYIIYMILLILATYIDSSLEYFVLLKISYGVLLAGGLLVQFFAGVALDKKANLLV